MSFKYIDLIYFSELLIRQWRRSSVFIVNFEDILLLVLVFLFIDFEHVLSGWEVFHESLPRVYFSYLNTRICNLSSGLHITHFLVVLFKERKSFE